MLMIRMEIACFLVITFMAIMYFSAKRKRTKIHNIFSALLLLSAINLIFDGVTIYTVNQLYSIPIWLNDIFHKVFLGTTSGVLYLVYRYIVQLVEDESGIDLRISRFSTVL